MRVAPTATVPRPEDDILMAFRGTSVFLRAVGTLTNSSFDETSRASGEPRRRIMATIGYDARGYARLAENIAAGVSTPRTFDGAHDREAAISFGEALPAHALRHLLEHSSVHLRVAWRDLHDWSKLAQDHHGLPLEVAHTPWLRARAVWLAAIDLDVGASFRDIPTAMLLRLADDCLIEADREGYHTRLTHDNGFLTVEWGKDTVAGPLPDVVRWMLGRGERGVNVVTRAGLTV